jgi:hypothetical protein
MPDMLEHCDEIEEDDIHPDATDTELDLWAVWSERQGRILMWTSRPTVRRAQMDFCKAMGEPWERLEARGHAMMPYSLVYCEHQGKELDARH